MCSLCDDEVGRCSPSAFAPMCVLWFMASQYVLSTGLFFAGDTAPLPSPQTILISFLCIWIDHMAAKVSSLFPEFRMNINIPTLCHICGHRYRSELHILIFVLRFGWIIEECGTNRISNCLLSLWKNDLYKSLRSPCVYERTNQMKSWNATTWHTYARAHATPAKKKDGGKKLLTEDRSTSRWEKCITNVQRNATTPFLLPLPPPPPSLPRQESEWIHAS